MKQCYWIFILLFYAFAKTGTTQNPSTSLSEVSGIYTLNNNPKSVNNIALWRLELRPDGTYKYHFKRQLKNQEVENFSSQGNYSAEGLLVTFITNDVLLKDNQSINLSGTKARVHKKHPRNKNPKKELIFIHFISSEEISMRGLKLYREDA